MHVSQQAVDDYLRRLQENERATKQELYLFGKNHPTEFVELCHQLLASPSVQVNTVVFSLLGQLGEKKDSVVEGKVDVKIYVFARACDRRSNESPSL